MGDVAVQLGFGPHRMRRSDRRGEHSYFGQEFALSLHVPLPWRGGAVVADVNYNHVAGTEQDLGSYRHMISGRIGLRQTVTFSSVFLFATARVGAGINLSRINYGLARVPLPDETNIPFQVSGQLGVGACIGRHPCIAGVVTLLYEVSSDHDNVALLFGPEFRFDFSRVAPPVSPDPNRIAERDQLRREIADLRNRPGNRPAVTPPVPPACSSISSSNINT